MKFANLVKEYLAGLDRLCQALCGLNGGLMAMCLLSLLPVGLIKTWASVEDGYWYACASGFIQAPVMQNLRWLRAPGNTLFFMRAMAFVLFIAGMKTGDSIRQHSVDNPSRA